MCAWPIGYMTAPAWGSAAVGGFNWCLVVIPSGLWSKNPGPVTVPVPAGRGQKKFRDLE